MVQIRRASLRSLIQSLLLGVFCLCVSAGVLAQETPKLSLDVSQPLFAVMTAMNACGYDSDLADSSPIRARVRAEVAEAVKTPRAEEAQRRMCAFYNEHMQPENARELAQYVSLALYLGDPPAFTPIVTEADMPPDALYVLGFVPLLQNFWVTADMNRTWRKHEHDYESLVEQFHKPVTELLFATDIYLKQPMSGYVGRGFTVYVEPMGPPGQVNARNYGADYFMVVSPEKDKLNVDKIRHTYLHYILDPLALKRPTDMRRISPILETVKTAPLDETYKRDITLLLTESLIRAVEARLTGGPKGVEAPRLEKVDVSMKEGFVLTRYFYEQLVTFEKSAIGLKDAYGDWLHFLDPNREIKRAQNIQFAATATPEVIRASQKRAGMLDVAERQLSTGNRDSAEKLARQALDDKIEDQGRASFILARVATARGDMKSAQFYFAKALTGTKDPKVLAWSNIYLGRIADIQQEREVAIGHYKAALEAGEAGPEAKTAAERGILQAYEPPKNQKK
jgi:hypothetical protein